MLNIKLALNDKGTLAGVSSPEQVIVRILDE